MRVRWFLVLLAVGLSACGEYPIPQKGEKGDQGPSGPPGPPGPAGPLGASGTTIRFVEGEFVSPVPSPATTTSASSMPTASIPEAPSFSTPITRLRFGHSGKALQSRSSLLASRSNPSQPRTETALGLLHKLTPIGLSPAPSPAMLRLQARAARFRIALSPAFRRAERT